jgi:hypothetical protein
LKFSIPYIYSIFFLPQRSRRVFTKCAKSYGFIYSVFCAFFVPFVVISLYTLNYQH